MLNNHTLEHENCLLDNHDMSHDYVKQNVLGLINLEKEL